jgi:hypothetical protein
VRDYFEDEAGAVGPDRSTRFRSGRTPTDPTARCLVVGLGPSARFRSPLVRFRPLEGRGLKALSRQAHGGFSSSSSS